MTSSSTHPPYASSEAEFWYNVMPQAQMPISGDIDCDFDVDRVATFLTAAAKDSAVGFEARVKAELTGAPSIFHDLRQLLGISDKRAYLELSYLASRKKHPTANTGICGCNAWDMARHPLEFFLRLAGTRELKEPAVDVLTAYLLREGLADAATGFAGLSAQQLSAIYKALVLPREVQQKAAKRRGHGCEAALANVIHACGVGLIPEDKHVNPMGAKDPNLDRKTLAVAPKKQGETFSFDMLVREGANVRVAIQSLIHTSDPGQYGVNKSDETVAVAEHIKASNQKRAGKVPLELWGLVDGVGFSENKADTINKMLRHFDCFVQLNTLYKAPLRLHQLGLCCVRGIAFSERYSTADVAAIKAKYVPSDVKVVGAGKAPSSWTEIPAGHANVFI